MPVLSQLGRKNRNAPEVLPKLEQSPETTGFFQNVSAGFTAAKAGPHSTQNAKAIYESRYYDQIIQALQAEGERGTDMVPSPVRADSPFYRPVDGEQRLPDGRVLIPAKRGFANPFSGGPSLTRDVNPLTNYYLGGDPHEQEQIWAAVNRVRSRKPDFLKSFKDPGSIDAMAKAARLADLERAQGITSRGTTLGKIGAFIGGAGGSVASLDPESFAGAFTSPVAEAAGKSIARQVIRHAAEGAAVNAGAGIIAVPGQETDSEALTGQHMTTGQMATSVGENALVGSLFGTAHVLAPVGARAVGQVGSAALDKVMQSLPAGARDPVLAASIRAGTVRDRGLLYEFQKLHTPYAAVDTSTPTEKAAAHVMMRDIETQEQSPLQPEHAPANNDRLWAVANSLGLDLATPELPTTAPAQTPTVRDRASGGRKPASYVDAVHAAEGTGKNPDSSAEGHFQFTKGTWREYAPRVTDTSGMTDAQVLALRHDKGIATKAEELFRADNGRYLRAHGAEDSPGNLSLAHFLGKSDTVKVLRADPATLIERIIDPASFAANRKLLEGKSADDVIAWAHKRIGAVVDHPPARPDAVVDEGFDYASPMPYTVETLRPHELPPTSAAAPTDEPFNPLLSQHLLVWEANDGTRSIMDGGKRLAHARSQEDQNVSLPTVVLKEADGVSEEMALLVGKLKNINMGTTSLEEAAGALADIPEIAATLRSPQFRRDIAEIAKLPYADFGSVVSGALEPADAINKVAGATYYYDGGSRQRVHHNSTNAPAWVPKDGDVALGAFDYGMKPGKSAVEVRHVQRGGHDLTWIGVVRPSVDARLGDRRNVARVGVWLRDAELGDARPLLNDLDELSRWVSDPANAKKVGNSAKLDAAFRSLIDEHLHADALAHRSKSSTSHPLFPDRREVDAANLAEIAGRLRDAQDGVTVFNNSGKAEADGAEANAISNAASGGTSEPSGGEGRDLAAQAPLADLPPGSEPSLFDQSIAARDSAEQFSDPHGSEAKQQTMLLEHDLRPKQEEGATEVPPAPEPEHLFDLKSTGFRISEEGDKPLSIEEILKSADEDDAAAEALRACL